MDHYANKRKLCSEVPASHSPPRHVPDTTSTLHFNVEGPRDDTNWFGTDEFSPFPNLVNDSNFGASLEGTQPQDSINLETLAPEQFLETQRHTSRPPSSTPEMVAGKRGKKQKTSRTALTNDFQERYLMLKEKEIERFAAIEEKKMEDPYSIKKCVTALEGLPDLQMEEMIKAADIFKENPANRETFLSFSRDETRLGWLRKQI
jgi:hypothetical protein